MTIIHHVSILYPFKNKTKILPDKHIIVEKEDNVKKLKDKISEAYDNIIPSNSIIIFKEKGSKNMYMFNNIIPFANSTILPDNEIYFCYDDSMPINYLTQKQQKENKDNLEELLICQICLDNNISTRFNCNHVMCYVCAYNIITNNNNKSCPFCRGEIKSLLERKMTGDISYKV